MHRVPKRYHCAAHIRAHPSASLYGRKLHPGETDRPFQRGQCALPAPSPMTIIAGRTSVYQGHEGVRQFWRESLSVFGEIDFEVEELIDAGDEVVAVIREREVGRASGVPVETTHLAVWTLADGKVVQMQMFDDRQQALEAAGVRE